LTGKSNVTTQTRSSISARRRHSLRQYFAIDGGSGAHLLAALGGYSPYLRPVASPRHADLLIIVAPISQKLVPAIVEIAQALPQPAHVLLIHEPTGELAGSSEVTIVDSKTLFRDVRSITTSLAEEVFQAISDTAPWAELALKDSTVQDTETIQLPSKQEQEMATELVVLSLGPIQPFTAGPLRIFLICDGEQVLSAQVESGYAQRGISRAMMQTGWQQSLNLARSLDPLAPIAGQLAYVRAIEQIQNWQPSPPMVVLREAALALERARNQLWWLVRFMRLLADVQLGDRAYQLATSFETSLTQLWHLQPATWILPQWQGKIECNEPAIVQLKQLADAVEAFNTAIKRNRWFALRTRGIGVLPTLLLKDSDISDAVLQENELGKGDVLSRLVNCTLRAVTDLRNTANMLSNNVSPVAHTENWTLPGGEAQVTVAGLRGQIGLHLNSDGGEKPAHVEWQSLSASLLSLLPEILAGQKLADAEIILASLNLAMAEADG